MTAGHDLALKGAMDYGTKVYSAMFDPGCDAYRSVKSDMPGTTFFSAKSQDSDAAYLSFCWSSQGPMAFPLSLYVLPLSFFRSVDH